MAAEPQHIVHTVLDRVAGHLPALGVALSGGGDSVALLHITADWCRRRNVRIEAATVDHGLRAESAAEARAAGAMAARLGIPHRVLRWERAGDRGGNLMAAARNARMALLGTWAGQRGLPAVVLGHTQDDQAETLMIRLARGSGVDGLSGMAEARTAQGVLWLRPMLCVGRQELRGWLVARGIGWIDDPTNENSDYDRVRMRQAMRALGLSAPALAQSAANLAEARAALAEAALTTAAGFRADRGVLWLPADGFRAAPAELRRRLFVAALRWVTGADYPPRREAVAQALDRLRDGGQVTLDGVIARLQGPEFLFLREPAAAARAGAAVPWDMGASDAGVVWDRRWRLTGLPAGATVTALGEKRLAGRDWRATGLPRKALLFSPAVVRAGHTLAPLLEEATGMTAMPLRDAQGFATILRTH
ncbi:MAG TPA: tRNA lysidine(34) synthetase TilS [Paracoccus sp. (in: a-proteobacteria)]|nr:tRNA lysidine(34) synthetase TilS [Paracoccus sp. (in: a-proteobacteria)]